MNVERMAEGEYAGTVVALARAFHHDPLFDFLIPDLVDQARSALTFMDTVLADAVPFGEVWVAREKEAVLGAAVWLPPSAYPRGARRSTVSILRDLRAVHRLGPRITAGIRLYGTVDRAHHRIAEDHWYLALLGTDPKHQGRGVGSSVLGPVLGRADLEGIPAYLETQKSENVPWYRRHGFDVVTSSGRGAVRRCGRCSEHRGRSPRVVRAASRISRSPIGSEGETGGAEER